MGLSENDRKTTTILPDFIKFYPGLSTFNQILPSFINVYPISSIFHVFLMVRCLFSTETMAMTWPLGSAGLPGPG
jgi:hypothetical protein